MIGYATSMNRSILPVATLSFLPLLGLACAGAGPVAGGGPSTSARPGAVTPVSAWPVPPNCASRFQPDSYGHVKNVKPLLISDADELRAQVECVQGVKLDFDFSAERIAMFPFASEGGSFKALSVEDDGEQVTLVVESSSYCGGTPPPTNTETFFYRVPRRTDALATKVVPANEPPCSPYLP